VSVGTDAGEYHNGECSATSAGTPANAQPLPFRALKQRDSTLVIDEHASSLATVTPTFETRFAFTSSNRTLESCKWQVEQ